MMQKKVKIGIVCLGRTTFDYKNAQETYKKNIGVLKNAYSDVEWIVIDDMVIEIEDSVLVANTFAQEMVDAIVLVSGTFHLGYLALEIYKKNNKPILLWGLNELPYDGGRIRLNSAVGVHLDASNLYKAGIDASIHIGDSIDDNWVRAIQGKNILANSSLAIVGGHSQSFYNFAVEDLAIFKKFSTMLHFYDLHLLYDQDVLDDEIQNYKTKLLSVFQQGNVDNQQLHLTARLAASIKKFMCSNKLNGLTLRGWPEFAQEYGVAPYAAMSILQSEGYVIANEGDIEGLLSMMLAKGITKTNPILMDFSQIYDDDMALLWHMGEAPCDVRSNDCKVSLDNYFAGGRGVTADFVLKEGVVTLFRVDTARGKTRIYMSLARVEKTEQEIRGNYARVSLDKGAKKSFKVITENGFGHHLVCVYTDIVKPLTIFAKIHGFEVIQ